MSNVSKWTYLHPYKDELICFERTEHKASCKKDWRGFKRDMNVGIYEYNIDGVVSYTVKVTAFRQPDVDMSDIRWMSQRVYTLEIPISPDDYVNHFIQLPEGYTHGTQALTPASYAEAYE